MHSPKGAHARNPIRSMNHDAAFRIVRPAVLSHVLRVAAPVASSRLLPSWVVPLSRMLLIMQRDEAASGPVAGLSSVLTCSGRFCSRNRNRRAPILVNA